jgi:thiamine biosynthesis protein ThiS
MKLFIEKDNKTKEIKFSGKVKDLLEKLDIISEDVIVSCNNEIVLLNDELKDSDNVSILAVVSGG